MNLRHPSCCQTFVAAALLALGGCTQTVVFPPPTTGSTSGSGALSSAGSSGSASSGTSTGSSSGGSSGQASSGSSGGSTTGTAYVDGGFVFCTVPDGGNGNPVGWLCPAGTYLCDLSGNTGNCFQCRSDADCRDQNLPTYDPRRSRCDLDSGIPGYQGFCQQCLGNADCDGNSAGAICDVSPSYPLDTIQGGQPEPARAADRDAGLRDLPEAAGRLPPRRRSGLCGAGPAVRSDPRRLFRAHRELHDRRGLRRAAAARADWQ